MLWNGERDWAKVVLLLLTKYEILEKTQVIYIFKQTVTETGAMKQHILESGFCMITNLMYFLILYILKKMKGLISA